MDTPLAPTLKPDDGSIVPIPTLPLTINPLVGATALAYVVDPMDAPPTIANELTGAHVPIPTFPFMTLKAAVDVLVVPMPTLPVL